MKIYNAEKTQELNKSELDLKLGYLKEDKLFIAHHEETEKKEEVSHYEVVKEYPNGGKDVEKVIDVPATEAHEAYDEYEDIMVYVPYTENELAANNARREIAELKSKLAQTDYQAIKYAEGEMSEAEYAEVKEKRRAWREHINELEELL